MESEVYRPKHAVRFVTAASLFDGHDAAINIMRRILQASGAEVVHLGHNRSVREIVETAVQEDVQGIAVSSYQGGHMEFFKYMRDLLVERGAGHIKIFGGGGGVIVPEEIAELEAYGIAKIFSPEDGMTMGLQGMINRMLEACDFPTGLERNGSSVVVDRTNHLALGHVLSTVERRTKPELQLAGIEEAHGIEFEQTTGTGRHQAPAVGVTGTGGAGKSTLTDELVRRFVTDFPDLYVAVLSVDPTRRRTGGALLGDRIRMNAVNADTGGRVYMRSFATRQANRATSESLADAIDVCRKAAFDVILVETAGIGQSDTEIVELTDVSIYVMTQDFGAPTQLEKLGMLDAADFVVINKFEKKGSLDALRDVRKQVQRNRAAFSQSPDEMPVFPTMASFFNDPGVTNLYLALLECLRSDFEFGRTTTIYSESPRAKLEPSARSLIPVKRQRYLAEIAETVRGYHDFVARQVEYARKWGEVTGAREQVGRWDPDDRKIMEDRLNEMASHWWSKLDRLSRKILEQWDETAARYQADNMTYKVRNRELSVPLFHESLSGQRIPRVALPDSTDPGERLRFALEENLPGFFPFSAGVFPFKRTDEDPTRMFAGEGSPERTNRRFHLVSHDSKAKRLSTAFDSVTLYGEDPAERPDIYGKVGNAGVSICTLDDMKKLYSGFNLCDPLTSVSMTINGPAPMILAMFMNTAIDQQVEYALKESGRWDAAESEIANRLGDDRPRYTAYGSDGLPEGHDGSGLGLLGISGADLVDWGVITREEYETIRAKALKEVRGTVQADILKEDQAQNTCIFSTEFALRMMGDVQSFFVEKGVRNYYSVSVSGYHIAEAGANPITQLALTLANGLTYVEYYLARGMKIDDFAPNLSFFFSNGLDPEYSVIGRVARRIWAVTMRDRYGGNERSQKLKYHIQTSGRSLHAKEIQFNDIRTTLQALIAIYDNCNSLHTNAYDEAITTPTEESVRRAMAIQMIINREFGLAKNENPLQGSYIVRELTDLVEKAVLLEFDRISERGGVLGAMETMYQRGKIQEESLHYERLKHTGDLPVVGVNVFLSKNGEQEQVAPVELMRSTEEEKRMQIDNLLVYRETHATHTSDALDSLRRKARTGENVFEELMETVKTCSLGQITEALFEVGGQYRRSM